MGLHALSLIGFAPFAVKRMGEIVLSLGLGYPNLFYLLNDLELLLLTPFFIDWDHQLYK